MHKTILKIKSKKRINKKKNGWIKKTYVKEVEFIVLSTHPLPSSYSFSYPRYLPLSSSK
jgi:hypothetical protein